MIKVLNTLKYTKVLNTLKFGKVSSSASGFFFPLFFSLFSGICVMGVELFPIQ